MDREKLVKEIAEMQDAMAKLEPTSDEYAVLMKRIRDAEELLRYSDESDPETIKAKAEQMKAEVQVDALNVEVEEGERSRKHSKLMTLWKGLGIVGLMFVSHCLSRSEIPDKVDQKLTETFWKEKE